MSSKKVLQQIIADPYRSKDQKDAAQSELDQINGVVRERKLLDKNSDATTRLAASVARLSSRVEEIEQKLKTVRIVASGIPGPEVDPSPDQSPVEPTPQETKSDGRGRPKARYIVQGKRGCWGVCDTVEDRFVWPVQNKRKDADAIARQLNASKLQPQNQPVWPVQNKRKDADAIPTVKEAQGTEPPQTAETGGKMYKPEDVKPAPDVRPDKMEARSATGRIPWYSK